MSYEEIFILGWLANILMLFINIVVVFSVVRTNEVAKLKEQSLALEELKKEYDKYYPYHKQMAIIAYFYLLQVFLELDLDFLRCFYFYQKIKMQMFIILLNINIHKILKKLKTLNLLFQNPLLNK